MKSNIRRTARLKDKVTVAQEEKYLTCGMVLCLVTLTDLKVRRAGLSASAELLCYSTAVTSHRFESTPVPSLNSAVKLRSSSANRFILPCASKNVRLYITLYNLKQLEPIVVVFGVRSPEYHRFRRHA